MNTFSQSNSERLAALLSYGLFPAPMNPLLFAGADNDDWSLIFRRSALHSTDAISFSGIMELPPLLRPNEALINDWKTARTRATVTGQWQIRMQSRVIDELKAANINAVVFGGADICGSYPKTELRQLGGIELLVPSGKLGRVAELFSSENTEYIDGSVQISVNGAKIYISELPFPKIPGICGDNLAEYIFSRKYETERIKLFGREFDIMDEERRIVSLLARIGYGLGDGTADMLSLCDWAILIHTVTDPKKWETLFHGIISDAGLANLAVYLTACTIRYLKLPSCPWSVDVSTDSVDRLFLTLMRSGNDSDTVSDDNRGVFTGIAEKRVPPTDSDDEMKRRLRLVLELHLFENGK